MAVYFKFRKEELPVAGEILLHLFRRDRAKFEEFSPYFNDDFVVSVEKQIQKLTELIQAPTLTAEITKLTEGLYQKMDDMIPNLDLIAAYAKRANKSLKIKASAFGVKEAKKQIRRRNVEGVVARLIVVQQNIANNLEVLQEIGYKEEIGKELEDLSRQVHEINLVQEKKLAERKQLVAENNAEFEALWKLLNDLSKTGKLLMREDKLKSEEYMLSNILKQVRNVPVKKEKKKEVKAAPVEVSASEEEKEPAQTEKA